VGEYLQIFRARVPQQSVAALLEIRPAAIAEAQRLCPELLGAQLVQLDDGTWLDVLTWSRPDGEQRLMARTAEFDAITKMHDLLADVEEPLRGARKRLVDASVQGAEAFAAFLDAGMGEVDPTLEEVEYRLLCEEVRISCTYGMLLCLSRPQRAAYLLADVLGLPDREGAEILGCTRKAFRQRVSRARRTLRQVIDNRCGLVDPANPCRCGRQIASSQAAGILERDRLPLARHAREEVRVWVEPVAEQLDAVVAIGDLYRFDRFAAPARLWEELQARFPDLLTST
jgi:hypothetical protein